MATRTYIYALLCPESGEVRYVGKANNPVARLARHMTAVHGWRCWLQLHRMEYKSKPAWANGDPGSRPRDDKDAWIVALSERGLEPRLAVLEAVPAERSAWSEAEQRWIDRFRAEGHPLLNKQDPGRPPTRRKDRVMAVALERGRKLAEALGTHPAELTDGD